MNETFAAQLVWEQFLLQYRENSEWIVSMNACECMAEKDPSSVAGKQWAAWKLYVADLKMKGEL